MKRIILSLAVVFVLSFSGCSTVQSVISAAKTVTTYKASPQTTEAIVVSSEKALAEAKIALETLWKLEHNHRDFIKKNFPSIHAAVERLRKDAPDVLIAADNVKNTFKHNRTTKNEADLRSVIATVKGFTAEAKELSKQLNNVSP